MLGCVSVDVPSGQIDDHQTEQMTILIGEPDRSCGDIKCEVSPRLIRETVPTYPPELYRKRSTGSAILVFDVDSSGRIADASVESATHPEFAEAILRSISSWEYKPALVNGVPVRVGPIRRVVRFGP